MTRRLVITADDFGRDAATNATIASLAQEAAITATSLIVVSPHAETALEMIRGLPLTPGLHVTLTSEQSLSPWRSLSGAPGLIEDGGHLSHDPERAVAAAAPDDVLAELDAQLAWMHERGASPRVVDSHSGTLYGVRGRSFLAETLTWCAAHGLALRLPREARSFLGTELPPALAAGHRAAVELADQLSVALPAAMITNRRTAAEHGSYEALREHMIAQLRDLPGGTSELFVHPSTASGPGFQVRRWERRLLGDPQWRRALVQEGFELVEGWQE